jgi:putative Ca2+/H+ antiporter (TMEM165/GDT1 family)
MPSGTSHIQDEMREVEEEIEEDDGLQDGTAGMRNGNVIPLESLEEGGPSASITTPYSRSSSPGASKGRSPSISVSRRRNSLSMKASHKGADLKQSIRNALQLVTNPVFAQAFVLTFLGEWGDRSQIATIALGGAHVRSLTLYE